MFIYQAELEQGILKPKQSFFGIRSGSQVRYFLKSLSKRPEGNTYVII